MKYILIIPVVLFVACGADKEKTKEASFVTTPANLETATVEEGGVSTVIKLPGQFAAYQEVGIFPRVNAYVKTVLADVGSRVLQGQLLVILEAPELQQAVMQAKEKYTKAMAEYNIDKERLQRLIEAAQTPGAISPLDLSTGRARIEADSAVANAEKANWQIQQTLLSYLRVTAPFSGIITERNIHPGALVSSSGKDKAMLELKQVDRLRLLIDVPEYATGSLKERDTVSFYAGALQGQKLTGQITRRSMNVSAQFRSERMEIDVRNNRQLLTPGMYAEIKLNTKGALHAMRVPLSSVVVTTERKYVLKSKEGHLTKVDVSTGNRSMDRIEVYGDLQPGDKVVLKATEETQ